jgi:hypothetical protein
MELLLVVDLVLTGDGLYELQLEELVDVVLGEAGAREA